jgi:hypothetical protein
MAVAGGLLLLGAWSALAVRAGGPSLERVEESWLWTPEERDRVRQSLESAGADAGVRRVALYDELSARARSRTPPFAYVRRDGYGIAPAINAALWSHRTHRGSAIIVIDPADPDGKEREIFTTTDGFIFDIHPSFDGRKLLMTYKEDVSAPFHIWEIGVDGTDLRQITKGPYHDVTPLYYPDGRIVFASSRCEQYAMCQDFLAFTLYICDADGGDIRRISFDTLCSVSPGLMRDGTIAASRWEYMDKTLWTWQGLWTVQPNGRMLQLLYGNTLSLPEALYAPRQIPDSHEVIYVMAGHYGAPIADLAIVDRRLGIENPAASRKLTHETDIDFRSAAGDQWRQTRTRNYQTNRRGYTDPWPFTRELSLASHGGTDPARAWIVLVDHGGLTYPLHQDSKQAAFSPVSLAPRPRGRILPGEAPQEEGFGVFYVQDIYEGLLGQGVERGQVAGLRVWRQVPKKYNTEGQRVHDHYPLVGWGTYYVKELYGTVPVGPSGALKFRAPANVELYFSAVDDRGREIQRMGTVTQIPPGETIGCIGCHEPRNQAPPVDAGVQRHWALPAVDPAPPPWARGAPPGTGHRIDYVAQVQPVWDRHCIECHHPRDPRGGIDLSGDKSRLFNMSYESLIVRDTEFTWDGSRMELISELRQANNRDLVDYYFLWAGPGGHFPALRTGSMASKLVDMLVKKHQDIELSDDELQTIAIWIDANVPYYGSWDMSRPRTPGGRDMFYTPRDSAWTELATAPDRAQLHLTPWARTIQQSLDELRIPFQSGMLNFTRPELSRVMRRHLSRDAGGWAGPDTALFKTTDDPRYRRLLDAIREGAAELKRTPRMDMPDARPIPQPREFDRVF